MSPSVAVFAIILYVCVVSGQQDPRIRLKGTGDEDSINIDYISGGNYPDGSFSIGHGINSPTGDGGPGADYPVSGGNRPVIPNYGGGNGQQNGGFINGQNDIGSFGGQNGQNRPEGSGFNEFGVPVQNYNPSPKPTNSYDNNYVYENSDKVPVRNSAPAPQKSIFARIWNFLVCLF